MEIVKHCSPGDSEFIKKRVIEHNMKKIPEELKTKNEYISFVAKNDSGAIIGGIVANTFWNHMHIDSLWVHEQHRGNGYGFELLKNIERVAIEKDCRFICLDTFSFQAPEFYKQHGYEVFGILEDHPKGFNQYFLQKWLYK